MDLSRVTILCVAASYALALLAEVAALATRSRPEWARAARWVGAGAIAAGLVAHVGRLLADATGQPTPLSSPADWCLVAALALAGVTLAARFAGGRWPAILLLPIVLGLVGASRVASQEPFAADRASMFWGQTHGWLLLAAVVTVSLGFVAGLMYLAQSWRLKRKLPPEQGLRLPPLEWLERVNSRALGVSVWLVAGGFLSGVVLSRLRAAPADGYQWWADPVVVSLAAMLGWLAAAETFRAVYPAARRGRKVAYLTVASFGFLLLTVASLTLVGPTHGGAAAAPPPIEPPRTDPAGGETPAGAAPRVGA